MFWTIAVILFGLWCMGMLSGGVTGAWIHLFLAFAVVSLVLALAGRLPRAAPRPRRLDELR